MDDNETSPSPKQDGNDARIHVSDVLQVDASAEQEARMLREIDL